MKKRASENALFWMFCGTEIFMPGLATNIVASAIISVSAE